MMRSLVPVILLFGLAFGGCGDGHSPTRPTPVATPTPTPTPEPAPAPAPAALSGSMTVSSALTKAGGYQYTVQIQVTEGAGVPKTIASIDVAGDDLWGDFPLIRHFEAEAWGSSDVVPAHGTSQSRPLVAIDEMPFMYFPSLRATITFSDGTSIGGTSTLAIDRVSPPLPEPPPGATFKVAGVVWDEHHIGTSGVAIEVQAGPNAGRKTTTAADGTYTLEVLTPGLLSVGFSKSGYQTSIYSTDLKSNLSISRELQLPR